jgi:hypothetical protein
MRQPPSSDLKLVNAAMSSLRTLFPEVQDSLYQRSLTLVDFSNVHLA